MGTTPYGMEPFCAPSSTPSLFAPGCTSSFIGRNVDSQTTHQVPAPPIEDIVEAAKSAISPLVTNQADLTTAVKIVQSNQADLLMKTIQAKLDFEEVEDRQSHQAEDYEQNE